MMNKLKGMLIGEDRNITKNMAISAICKPISMVVSYIYVPIVLNYLGLEKYGIWATILTILSWIGYFDIGMGNGLRNKLTESLSKNKDQSKKLVTSAYAFISVIMITAVIILSLIASKVDWNRVFGVSDIRENLSMIVIISVCFTALNFILSICKNVLYALQKAADVSVMELATQVVNLIGILIAMRFVKNNLFVMVFVYGLSMTIVNLTASFFVYRKNDDIKPNIKEIDKTAGKSIINLGTSFFIIQICGLVLFTTDSLIISYLYGASNVTPYNTVNKLFNVIVGIYGAMLAPVWSNVTKLKSENKYNEIKKMIIRLQLIMIPFITGAILLMLIFRPVTRLWLGVDLAYTKELIVLGMMYCVLNIWCNTYACVANGLEIMKISTIVAIVQALVNIPMSLIFAIHFNMQSSGVLAGTIFSMLIAAIIHPIAVKRRINQE